MKFKNEFIANQQERSRLNKAVESGQPAFTTGMFIDQEAFYDQRADIYDEQNEIPERAERRKAINAIYHSKLKNLIAGKDLIYLDFGCGTGTDTNKFLGELGVYARIQNGYAMDISSGMVNIAKENLPNFTVSQGTAETMQLENALDLVTSFFHVLCHLNEDELNAFFKNVHKALKKGGLLTFDVVAQFNVGEHGYTKEDFDANRKYLTYLSTKKDGSKVLTKVGVPMMGTDRMFTKEDILHFAEKYSFEPVDISELDINRQGSDGAIIREYLVILKKI